MKHYLKMKNVILLLAEYFLLLTLNIPELFFGNQIIYNYHYYSINKLCS